MAQFHRQSLIHGQSSPDLVFIGNSGGYTTSGSSPHTVTGRLPDPNLRHTGGSRYSASSMHSPKGNSKEALLDRRLSLPDSVMNVDFQIAPNSAMLQNQAFPEHNSPVGLRSSDSGSASEGDRRPSAFSPSLLESQV